MSYEYDDGGRAAAGFKGDANDCAVRAAAIATSVPYLEVYKAINEFAGQERPTGNKKRSNSRTGVWPKTLAKFLEPYGFEWRSTMQIGSGCKVHLTPAELPNGDLVVRVSRHFVAVIDGVIRDTFDPSRDGTRCVYGYFIKIHQVEEA